MFIRNTIIVLLCLFLFIPDNPAQNIVRVVQELILIDTDQDLGVRGDTLAVFQEVQSDSKQLAEAVIVRFQDGHTAAKLISGQIDAVQDGDIVQRIEEPNHLETAVIINVVKDYILLDTDLSFQRGVKFQVFRGEAATPVTIGEIQFEMIKNGKMVARVVHRTPGTAIQKGDWIILNHIVDSVDIDGYFFESFNP